MTTGRLLLASIVFLGLGVRDVHGALAPSKTEIDWFRESRQNFEDVIGYLWPALRSAHKPGRVYFGAYCPPTENNPVVFPKLRLLPPPRGTLGRAAVQAIFRDESDAVVRENADHIVRVTAGNVNTAVLSAPIPKLTFDPIAQYNEVFAIQRIVWSDEVKSAMLHLGIRTPNRPMDMPFVKPDKKLPHLPPVVSHVTMDQALDLVAKTFHSIVFYGMCTNTSMYEVWAAGGYYWIDPPFRQ